MLKFLNNQVNYLIFQVSYINPFKYINKVKVISVTIWQLCKTELSQLNTVFY